MPAWTILAAYGAVLAGSVFLVQFVAHVVLPRHVAGARATGLGVAMSIGHERQRGVL